MSLIQLKDVTKTYDAITALDHLTLAIEDKEYVCILGPTGAGKTTLLRIIAGLLEPDEGEIYIDGKRVNGLPPEERNAVYMFQQYALFPHMNVWENVSFSPVIKDYSETRIERLTQEILDMVKLTERSDALPHELSGGMQQRVALARGLASGARILLLDEPLGALDARLRIELRVDLKRFAKKSGFTVIHVTHDQEEAIIVAVREESTRLTLDDTGEGMNILDGEITQMYFLGNFTRFEVKLKNSDLVSSLMPIDNLTRRLKLGDRVRVIFNPKSTLIYDYPTLGLRHELEVY